MDREGIPTFVWVLFWVSALSSCSSCDKLDRLERKIDVLQAASSQPGSTKIGGPSPK